MSLPLDDPTQRRPDISLAMEKLGWKPTVKLDAGLDEASEFFKKQRIAKNQPSSNRSLE